MMADRKDERIDMVEHKRIVLARRPNGMPEVTDFRMEEATLGTPAQGQVLLRTIYLSLDPFVRGRLGQGMTFASPVPPLPLDEVVPGGTVSEVIESNDERFQAGDIVLGNTGWQSHAIADASGLRPIDPSLAPISTALGVLGMPAFTGWVAMRVVARPEAGQTVLISAASGAVGSMAGQLAKLDGARVVGIAGGPEKCAWLREIGFDAAVDHRSPTFGSDLAAAVPEGVDVYLENVGGRVLEAVLPTLNYDARVPVCGLVSSYNGSVDAGDLRVADLMSAVLMRRITMQGFSFPGYVAEYDSAFREEVSAAVAAGNIAYREDVREGLESAPEAFIGLFSGANQGKLLVRVGTDHEGETK